MSGSSTSSSYKISALVATHNSPAANNSPPQAQNTRVSKVVADARNNSLLGAMSKATSPDAQLSGATKTPAPTMRQEDPSVRKTIDSMTYHGFTAEQYVALGLDIPEDAGTEFSGRPDGLVSPDFNQARRPALVRSQSVRIKHPPHLRAVADQITEDLKVMKDDDPKKAALQMKGKMVQRELDTRAKVKNNVDAAVDAEHFRMRGKDNGDSIDVLRAGQSKLEESFDEEYFVDDIDQFTSPTTNVRQKWWGCVTEQEVAWRGNCGG